LPDDDGDLTAAPLSAADARDGLNQPVPTRGTLSGELLLDEEHERARLGLPQQVLPVVGDVDHDLVG
jgi:hypothetical protein